ncbi:MULTISPECIES: GPO family capsid scaffolding protein [unclassified Serratia (in: enterobacteria)]|uniref:GPO family capsid scaffolding protein n=1 Tax=unclassified Serratia (in: enterobacteria) TaxID=2647522 RepID=UPI0030760C4D
MNKKMFLVATSGKTVDGREFSAADIMAIASNYNTATRTAIIAEQPSLSSTLGFVESTRAEMVGDKADLYVEVKASKDFLELSKHWKENQYLAITILYGEGPLPSPYLIGLFLTTTPACLGTDVITTKDLAECVA